MKSAFMNAKGGISFQANAPYVFTDSRPQSGVPWIVYGILAYNQGRPNDISMTLFAGWWR